MKHNLTPVYTPISWSVNPPEVVETPKMRRQMKRVARLMSQALQAGIEAQFSTSMPVKRNRVAEEMGDEYVEGLDFDKLRFEIEMLKP